MRFFPLVEKQQKLEKPQASWNELFTVVLNRILDFLPSTRQEFQTWLQTYLVVYVSHRRIISDFSKRSTSCFRWMLFYPLIFAAIHTRTSWNPCCATWEASVSVILPSNPSLSVQNIYIIQNWAQGNWLSSCYERYIAADSQSRMDFG